MGAPCFWNFGSLKFGRIGADPNILLGASTSINEKSRAAHIKYYSIYVYGPLKKEEGWKGIDLRVVTAYNNFV